MSQGCWRAILAQKLIDAGAPPITFVGTLPPTNCSTPISNSLPHDGHAGFRATGIVADNQLPGWLSLTTPDIMMMHLGTNDILSKTASTTEIISAYSTLVDQMRAQKASIRILVAKIIPVSPGGCDTCAQATRDLNDAVAEWARGESTVRSEITVVDCWTGFNSTADTVDGIHPNGQGGMKLANAWFGPVRDAIVSYNGTSSAASGKVTGIGLWKYTTFCVFLWLWKMLDL
jgi:hypothetical protein